MYKAYTQGECGDVDDEVLWRKEVGLKSADDDYRGYLMEHGYASATPVTDGEHVYVFLGKAGLHCFSIDGEEVTLLREIKTGTN